MQPQEVKDLVASTVRGVLAEQKRLHNAEADTVVLQTISTILTSFGIEEEDRVELRADFQHLRKWRKSAEQVQSLTIKAMVTIIVGGVAGASGSASRRCLVSHKQAAESRFRSEVRRRSSEQTSMILMAHN